MTRRIALIIASLIVSIAFLVLVLRDVPLADVGRSLAQADVAWLLLAFGVGCIGIFTRSIRWRGLLDDRIGLVRSFYILGVTFLANQLPLRAGEVARVLLARREGVPVFTAATSIIVERLLDTLTVVLMILFVLSQLPTLPVQASRAAGVFGVLGVIGFGVLVGVARYPNLARGLLAEVLRRVPALERLPLSRLLDNVIDGLHPLADMRRFGHALLWTAISWSLSVSTLYLLLRALNITDVNLLYASLLGVALASLSVAVPVSLAALGPFQASIVLMGQVIGVGDIEAISLGFLFHGLTLAVYITMGVVGLLALGISLGDVVRQEQPDAMSSG